MNQAVTLIGIIAALVCIAAATVCLFVAPGLAQPLAVVGIGWAVLTRNLPA
jgi:hypothetical protein